MRLTRRVGVNQLFTCLSHNKWDSWFQSTLTRFSPRACALPVTPFTNTPLNLTAPVHGRRARVGRRNAGFALLITITLLAFLVLLLVSLASLTRVETQVATNSQKISQARQNAMLALNVAIGSLQKQAGLDQRLTARADLTSTATLRQPYLTGLWESVAGVPTLRSWLVSGNEGANPLSLTPANAPDPAVAAGADEVFLVGEATVATSAERVKLVRQPLVVPSAQIPGFGSAGADVVVGHYAYWVGDQGVKSSAALNDQSDTLNYDDTRPAAAAIANASASGSNWTADPVQRARLRQLSQPRPRSEKQFTSFLPDSVAQLANALTYQQLPLGGGITANESRARFHDAAAVNYAVLVDHSVANGALRQDFSDSTQTASSAIKNYIRERPATITGLQTFHDQKQAESKTDTIFPMFSKGPVLTECAIRFQFYRNGTNQLALKYEIQAELWNPYAVTINASADLSLQFTNLPVVTVTVGTSSYAVDLNAQLLQGSTYIPIVATVSNNASTGITTWAPGQIRVVRGGGGGNVLSVSGGAARSAVANVGTATTLATATLPPGVIPGGLIVSIPAIDATAAPFTVEVKTKGNTLGFYRPAIAFTAATVSRVPPEDLSSNAGFLFGYAYDFRDEPAYWTDGSSGTAGNPPQDPRRTNLGGAFYDASFPVWSTGPADNLGDINQASSGGFFNAAKRYSAFDLGAQEPFSLGSLQHVIGEKPNMLGNTWGGAANDYFDKYFFSTIPRWFAWDPAAPSPLPNRYTALYVAPGSALPAIGDSSPGVTDDSLRDRLHSAKHLLIRGAFNINSTSETAWRAVLGGVKIPAWSYGGASPSAAALDNAHFRFSASAQEFSTDPALAPTSTGDQDFNRGVHVLTDAQVSALATSVVNSLKARGRPFPTLASFVNAGVLAQAITDAGINPAGVRAYSPGWLSQADILTSIAPFITPRSDTFVIRAYGDAVNPVTGETEGRVWCEAIVQRTPDLTTPATGTTNVMTDPLAPNPAKYPFGRKFQITQFQWLSSTDI